MQKIFLLGGGIAALTAARRARELAPSALIVFITDESVLPYSRPMLTKQLMSSITAADLAVEPASWYDRHDIIALTGRTVTAIDPTRKTLVAGGTEFGWDRLIIATGASCFVPPIPGAQQPHVLTIRSAADAERVREAAKTARTAAVIGGGVLGLEAASALNEAGLAVTVLETADQIMKRQIDRQAAEHLEAAMAKKGVTLIKNADTAQIDAQSVTLRDGRTIPAELVVVSAGVRANLALAKEAGLHTERQIVVDDHMRTSATDVFACGDCASMGMSYALWPEAMEMGLVAGENAVGGDATYHAKQRPVIFHGFGTELFAMGDCGRDAAQHYEVGEMPGARYYSVNGQPVGAVLTGDISRMGQIEEMLLANQSLSPISEKA